MQRRLFTLLNYYTSWIVYRVILGIKPINQQALDENSLFYYKDGNAQYLQMCPKGCEIAEAKANDYCIATRMIDMD
jgi:hypothetical protein